MTKAESLFIIYNIVGEAESYERLLKLEERKRRAPMVVLDGEKYLDGSEACRMLGVKAATLYAYVSRGVLKSYKQGIKRQRLYKQTELEALLQLRPSDAPLPGAVQEEVVEQTSTSKKDSPDIPKASDWIPYF